ncbi:MAG: hypothetical protein JTJ12_06550 [Eubacterium sp.]|nr:hypothetical protein [Eubacterium sp.]
MDALLNERSLCGQFDDIYSFLDSVKPVIRCIELIHENSDIAIYKTADFYDCKITKDERLCDLAKYKLTDELLRLKISLDREVYEKPHWDDEPIHNISKKFFWNDEDVSATSLAEAAIKGDMLLSFFLEIFKDKKLIILNEGNIYSVDSVHTPRYLVEKYSSDLHINRKESLQILYEDTRIDCSTMEDGYGAEILQKHEFEGLIKSFDKFVQHESWESIALDDGLEYKKYTPAEKKKNWFLGKKYSGKTIMKFRFSGVMRCFGYRKGDRFKVLRLERDHTVSDNG